MFFKLKMDSFIRKKANNCGLTVGCRIIIWMHSKFAYVHYARMNILIYGLFLFFPLLFYAKNGFFEKKVNNFGLILSI